jgi:transposase
MARLHAMVAEQVGDVAEEDVEVLVGIETDRGPWVRALVAAGYTVFAVNPSQASRYRARLGVSGAKSDAGDAHRRLSNEPAGAVTWPSGRGRSRRRCVPITSAGPR